MADRLRIDVDAAFNAAKSVQGDAEDLRDGLLELAQKWQSLSDGWSGAAASAYSPLFSEWHDSAATLVAALEESASNLAEAGVRYQEEDSCSAESVAATARDMGL